MVKRFVDIMLAFVVGLVCAIPIVVVALAVRFTSMTDDDQLRLSRFITASLEKV